MKNCPKCNESVKGKTAFCPSCGEKLGRRSTNEKKTRLTEKKKSSAMPLAAAGIVILVGAVALFALFRPDGTASTAAVSTNPSGDMTLPVSTFDDGKARYYNYEAPGGTNIKFFVLKSSDGVIRAAFDACDVCFGSKKGYRQEGDFMVCNNCDQRFTSVRINEVKGGCNPAPLERKVEGTNLVLKTSDIVTGARYF